MSRPDALHEQLIQQARHLATREPKHPQQASLRRAISAAYYALFHFLIDEATRAILGASDAGRPSREAIARGFDHGKMAEASKIFQGDSLSDRFRLGSIPTKLKQVAKAFVDLQEQRHKADYDLSATFSSVEVRDSINMASEAMMVWPEIRDEPASRFYLLALFDWERINKINR